MGVGAGLYMHVVVVQKFTFAISSPDEFLYLHAQVAVGRRAVGVIILAERASGRTERVSPACEKASNP